MGRARDCGVRRWTLPRRPCRLHGAVRIGNGGFRRGFEPPTRGESTSQSEYQGGREANRVHECFWPIFGIFARRKVEAREWDWRLLEFHKLLRQAPVPAAARRSAFGICVNLERGGASWRSNTPDGRREDQGLRSACPRRTARRSVPAFRFASGHLTRRSSPSNRMWRLMLHLLGRFTRGSRRDSRTCQAAREDDSTAHRKSPRPRPRAASRRRRHIQETRLHCRP